MFTNHRHAGATSIWRAQNMPALPKQPKRSLSTDGQSCAFKISASFAPAPSGTLFALHTTPKTIRRTVYSNQNLQIVKQGRGHSRPNAHADPAALHVHTTPRRARAAQEIRQLVQLLARKNAAVNSGSCWHLARPPFQLSPLSRGGEDLTGSENVLRSQVKTLLECAFGLSGEIAVHGPSNDILPSITKTPA